MGDTNMRVGIGLVGPIIAPTSAGGSQFLSGVRALVSGAPQIAGADTAVAELVDRTGGQVWLVAKVGQVGSQHVWWWLRDNRFLDRVGLGSDHVAICPPGRGGLAGIAALRLTHFAGSQAGLLQDLRGWVPNLVHFGADESQVIAGCQPAATWGDVRLADATSAVRIRHAG